MVRRSHQQLALAFPGHRLTLKPTPRTARARAAQTPIDRSTAIVTARIARTRTTLSRDSRGRFVSFPTTDAPSWYVFSTDRYRIPGEPLPEALAPVAPTARQPLPRAVARPRRTVRTRLSRADLLTYLVLAIGFLALLWYGLHLPRPHR
jgi:hypothetical protein